jgi:hypothetical protein
VTSEPVADLGDKAVWWRQAGQLWVFKKEIAFAVVIAGGAQDDATKLRAATTLARQVAGRLPA